MSRLSNARWTSGSWARFDCLSLAVIDGGEPLQSLIESEQLNWMVFGIQELVIKLDPLLRAAALAGNVGARVVYKKTPHSLSGNSEEVGPVLPILVTVAKKAKVGLMYQRGGLQCVVGPLAAHAARGEFAQGAIDDRQELVRSLAITIPHADQESGNLVGTH